MIPTGKNHDLNRNCAHSPFTSSSSFFFSDSATAAGSAGASTSSAECAAARADSAGTTASAQRQIFLVHEPTNNTCQKCQLLKFIIIANNQSLNQQTGFMNFFGMNMDKLMGF